MSTIEDSHELARVAAAAAADKLATEIVAFDVSAILALSDVFVVASAANTKQLDAVVDEVEYRTEAAGARPARREGDAGTPWVLLDFGDIVVHVQLAEVRAEYGLERLWRDCPVLDLRLPEAVGR